MNQPPYKKQSDRDIERLATSNRAIADLMQQGDLDIEIEKIKLSVNYIFREDMIDGAGDRWVLWNDVVKAIEQVAHSIAQKTIEAVRVEKIKVCGCPPFQSNHDGYCSSPEPGWENFNQAVTKQNTKAAEWLGKE